MTVQSKNSKVSELKSTKHDDRLPHAHRLHGRLYRRVAAKLNMDSSLCKQGCRRQTGVAANSRSNLKGTSQDRAVAEVRCSDFSQEHSVLLWLARFSLPLPCLPYDCCVTLARCSF